MNKERINIRTIKHKNQRYETLGDYFYDEFDTLYIKVSDTGNQYYNRIIVIHELIEELLTRYKGIKEEKILEWDNNHLDSDDPGSLKDAPYNKEHLFALQIEKDICYYLGLDWDIYEERLKDIR